MVGRKSNVGIFFAESLLHARPRDSKKKECSAHLGAESCPDSDNLLSTCVQMDSRCIYISILVQIRTGYFTITLSYTSHHRAFMEDRKLDSIWLKPEWKINSRCAPISLQLLMHAHARETRWRPS